MCNRLLFNIDAGAHDINDDGAIARCASRTRGRLVQDTARDGPSFHECGYCGRGFSFEGHNFFCMHG